MSRGPRIMKRGFMGDGWFFFVFFCVELEEGLG